MGLTTGSRRSRGHGGRVKLRGAVQPANEHPRLEKFHTDDAYDGKCAQGIEQAYHIRVEIVLHRG